MHGHVWGWKFHHFDLCSVLWVIYESAHLEFPCALFSIYTIFRLYIFYNSILLKVKNISQLLWMNTCCFEVHFMASSNEFCICLLLCFKADNVKPSKCQRNSSYFFIIIKKQKLTGITWAIHIVVYQKKDYI